MEAHLPKIQVLQLSWTANYQTHLLSWNWIGFPLLLETVVFQIFRRYEGYPLKDIWSYSPGNLSTHHIWVSDAYGISVFFYLHLLYVSIDSALDKFSLFLTYGIWEILVPRYFFNTGAFLTVDIFWYTGFYGILRWQYCRDRVSRSGREIQSQFGVWILEGASVWRGELGRALGDLLEKRKVGQRGWGWM